MTIDQFTVLLIKSRLSTKTEAEKLAAVFQDACHRRNAPDTVERFCDFLTSTGRITTWQCEKLRMGKWKGFYLDDYVLVDLLGNDHVSLYYKARDIRDGAFVSLAVTPSPGRNTPGIEYRVEPYAGQP